MKTLNSSFLKSNSMKKFTLLSLLFLLFTINVYSQTFFIDDYITYDSSCDSENVVIKTNPFNYEINFESNVNQGVWDQFHRNTKLIFSDANGNVLKEIDVVTSNINTTTIEIDESDLFGLPDGEIHMSLVVTYEYIKGNPYINPLTVYDNGAESCYKVFTIQGQTLECIISDILCFTYNNCDDYQVSLYKKMDHMYALVNPSGGNISYQWEIYPNNGFGYSGGTQNKVKLYNGCASYKLTVTDLDTGCKYVAWKKACKDQQEPPCLLGTPSNLTVTATGNPSEFVLTWDPAFGAGFYTVEVTINDQKCCGNGQAPQSLLFTDITKTSVTINVGSFKDFPCFSWTVTAHCPNGTGNASASNCFIIGFRPNDDAEVRSTIEDMTLNIFPNPASTTLNLEMSGLVAESANVRIMDINGMIIFNTVLPTTDNQISYTWNIPEELSSGMYFIQIDDNKNVHTKKFYHIK